MKRMSMLVVVALCAAFLAACGGSSSGGGASMTDVAKQFYEALINQKKDAGLAVVCESQKANAENSFTGASMMPAGAQIDLSGLKYEGKESGDTGTVTISGNMKVTIAGQTTEAPVTGALAQIPMKKEGGAWKVCPGG